MGLTAAGWLAGTGYAATLLTLVVRAARPSSLGPADQVTLARAVLVGGVVALVAGHPHGGMPTAVFVSLTAVALSLDAVDGQVARRTGTVSPRGARFDMEVDAFLIFVLSAYAATFLGVWVLTIGVLRYAFVAAGWVLPWLCGPLTPSSARKAVAAMQGVFLLVAVSGLVPYAVEPGVAGLALAALGWSFGRDTRRLWLDRRGTDSKITTSAQAHHR
ncbi:CDP-alcohol phosphatidyltransferase family protein [Amycolatopsis sp. H20-H5]|uniref:CDP-alcohol phosphatidyltransferase family protein n=1 Tax=Amycolatopsis sp. H20-H5 TaxID=3046309 RepID=UPI002DBD373B|nr:CDP-alcohol phosphatidyltransferase family protein [Amycolatopsis sp. H20-H5]MEC3982247.1 CDP-alcohol phosphatidyltransferase family protein [Amycolatopsis sp. H20-H5]